MTKAETTTEKETTTTTTTTDAKETAPKVDKVTPKKKAKVAESTEAVATPKHKKKGVTKIEDGVTLKVSKSKTLKDVSTKASEVKHPATFVASRHPGAIEFIGKEYKDMNFPNVQWTLDGKLTTFVKPGDSVIGVLPIARVSELTALGVKYYALEPKKLDKHEPLRGKARNYEELVQVGTKLVQYVASIPVS